MTATPSQQRETLAALTAQVRCDLEQHHPDTDITDETISLVLELSGPRMRAAALREAADFVLTLPTRDGEIIRVARLLIQRADRIEAGD